MLTKATAAYTETEIDDEIVVMSLESGDFFSLIGMAREVWQRLDQPVHHAALIDGLAADFGGDRALIAADVDAFLDQLRAAGLLTGQ